MISSSKNFGTVFFCIPLSPFVLAISLFLVAWGCYDITAIVSAHSDGESWDFASGLGMMVACLRTLGGLGGVVAVVFLMSFGLALLMIFYKILLFSSIVSFVILWIYWICWLAGLWTDDGENWEPTDSEVTMMITLTVLYVLFFAISWWALSAMKSLKYVIDVGGNGWEGKNYKQLKEVQKTDLVEQP